MKKRGLLLLITSSIVLIGGIAASLMWQPDPNQLVLHGLEKLNGAPSFRYSITQHQWVEGKDRVLIQILGEKDGENSHISGQLVGSEVEMVQTGDALYTRDPFSKKWIRFDSAQAVQEVFMAELNPLSSLQLRETGEVMLSGQEKVNGQKVWVCQLKPSVQNQLMDEFWTDFVYTLYVSKSDQIVVKAIIQAQSKTKTESMSMTLEFKDIGQSIHIQAPPL